MAHDHKSWEEFNNLDESRINAEIVDYIIRRKLRGPKFTPPKKKRKKKIKLIFMIYNLESVFEKDKNNQVKVEFKNQIENQLTEQFGQKVILEDVQIIHR